MAFQLPVYSSVLRTDHNLTFHYQKNRQGIILSFLCCRNLRSYFAWNILTMKYFSRLWCEHFHLMVMWSFFIFKSCGNVDVFLVMECHKPHPISVAFYCTFSVWHIACMPSATISVQLIMYGSGLSLLLFVCMHWAIGFQ